MDRHERAWGRRGGDLRLHHPFSPYVSVMAWGEILLFVSRKHDAAAFQYNSFVSLHAWVAEVPNP